MSGPISGKRYLPPQTNITSTPVGSSQPAEPITDRSAGKEIVACLREPHNLHSVAHVFAQMKAESVKILDLRGAILNVRECTDLAAALNTLFRAGDPNPVITWICFDEARLGTISHILNILVDNHGGRLKYLSFSKTKIVKGEEEISWQDWHYKSIGDLIRCSSTLERLNIVHEKVNGNNAHPPLMPPALLKALSENLPHAPALKEICLSYDPSLAELTKNLPPDSTHRSHGIAIKYDDGNWSYARTLGQEYARVAHQRFTKVLDSPDRTAFRTMLDKFKESGTLDLRFVNFNEEAIQKLTEYFLEPQNQGAFHRIDLSSSGVYKKVSLAPLIKALTLTPADSIKHLDFSNMKFNVDCMENLRIFPQEEADAICKFIQSHRFESLSFQGIKNLSASILKALCSSSIQRLNLADCYLDASDLAEIHDLGPMGGAELISLNLEGNRLNFYPGKKSSGSPVDLALFISNLSFCPFLRTLILPSYNLAEPVHQAVIDLLKRPESAIETIEPYSSMHESTDEAVLSVRSLLGNRLKQ